VFDDELAGQRGDERPQQYRHRVGERKPATGSFLVGDAVGPQAKAAAWCVPAKVLPCAYVPLIVNGLGRKTFTAARCWTLTQAGIFARSG